ncbi:MAG: hypothetical protein ACLR8M_11260 [Oscillospiraceae bacterium]
MGLPLKSQVTAQVIFRSPHVTVIVALPLADGGDLGQYLGLVVVRRAHNGVAGDADDALIRALERHGLLAAGIDGDLQLQRFVRGGEPQMIGRQIQEGAGGIVLRGGRLARCGRPEHILQAGPPADHIADEEQHDEHGHRQKDHGGAQIAARDAALRLGCLGAALLLRNAAALLQPGLTVLLAPGTLRILLRALLLLLGAAAGFALLLGQVAARRGGRGLGAGGAAAERALFARTVVDRAAVVTNNFVFHISTHIVLCLVSFPPAYDRNRLRRFFLSYHFPKNMTRMFLHFLQKYHSIY